MNKYKIFVCSTALFAAMGLTACANHISPERKNRELVSQEQRAMGLRDARPNTIFQMGQGSVIALAKPVRVNVKGVSLMSLFNSVAPDMDVIATDGHVDLSRLVSVQIRSGTLKTLLDQLTANANYAFHVHGKTIEVSSMETRTWNLAAFSAAQRSSGTVGSTQSPTGSGGNSGGGGGSSGSGGGGGGVSVAGSAGSSAISTGGDNGSSGSSTGGVTTRVENDEDEWGSVVSTARAMLGLETTEDSDDKDDSSSDDGDKSSDSAAAYNKAGTTGVVAIRSMGLIRATGEPRRIQQLDNWLSSLQDISTEQYHLDVKAMEVTLNNDSARGINWQALVSGKIANRSLGGMIGFSGPIDTSRFQSDAGGLSVEGGNDGNFNSVLQFLAQYGEVDLINEPNLTVTNGRTANITTGREFSYIATIQQVVVEGGTSVSTPQISRILVGVKIAVTPRRLDDGRILMNVVPIITSLQGFDNLTVGDNTFRSPNIRLQSLATQVITRPGVPIHIGGLINSRLQSTLNTLPVKEKLLVNPLKWLFSSEQESMERRELVIMITPNVVDP